MTTFYALAALANDNDVLFCPITIFGFLCLDPSQLLYSVLLHSAECLLPRHHWGLLPPHFRNNISAKY